MYEIKCECQIACQKIFRQSVTWWGSLEESNLFPRLSACFQHAFSQNDALWGPARIIAIINHGNDIKHLILDSFVSFLFALGLWWRILHRYVSTNRRLYAQKPYTEQLLRADILTQHKKECTQTPLHTEVFMQSRKYLHTDALYKDVLARRNKGT